MYFTIYISFFGQHLFKGPQTNIHHDDSIYTQYIYIPKCLCAFRIFPLHSLVFGFIAAAVAVAAVESCFHRNNI